MTWKCEFPLQNTQFSSCWSWLTHNQCYQIVGWHRVLGSILTPKISRPQKTLIFKFLRGLEIIPSIQFYPIPRPLIVIFFKFENRALTVPFCTTTLIFKKSWFTLSSLMPKISIHKMKNKTEDASVLCLAQNSQWFPILTDKIIENYQIEHRIAIFGFR